MANILVERRGRVGLVTVNRPEKRNAFTVKMFRLLTDGFTQLDADDAVRAVIVHAAGEHFTAGLDLTDVTPSFLEGIRPFSDQATDPWDVAGRPRRKPMVMAVHGSCLTLGFELVLAADACVAARDTVFALREVRLGILPLGGGVVRLIEAVGWSTAMRYVLTGGDLGAEEACRLGRVQEVVERGAHLERAMTIAETIASQPPQAVRAPLEHGREALHEGRRGAMTRVVDRVRALMHTEDAQEAAMALIERRGPVFRGR